MKRTPQHEWVIPSELGEDGIPNRPPRTDIEIVESVKARRSLPCIAHNLVDCVTCQQLKAPPNKSTVRPGDSRSYRSLPGTPLSLNDRYDPPIVIEPTDESLAEDKRRDIEARRRWMYRNCEDPQPKNLRLLHGYSARQLAKLFDEPGFIPVKEKRDLLSDDICIVNGKKLRKTVRQINRDIGRGKRKRFPKTIFDLQSCAPIILVPELSPDAVAFYKDLASGNFKTEMIHRRIKDGRYGKQRDKKFFNPVEIADWIIKRAWSLNLLKPNQNHSSNPDSTVPDQGPVEVDHDLEIKAMGKGIGTIGQVVKAKHGRPLDSFEGGRQYGPGHIYSDPIRDYSPTNSVGRVKRLSAEEAELKREEAELKKAKGEKEGTEYFGPISTEGVADRGGSQKVKDGGNNQFDQRGIDEFYEGGDEFAGLTDDYSERSGDDIKRLD